MGDADAGYDARSVMFAAAMAHAPGKTADETGEGLGNLRARAAALRQLLLK